MKNNNSKKTVSFLNYLGEHSILEKEAVNFINQKLKELGSLGNIEKELGIRKSSMIKWFKKKDFVITKSNILSGVPLRLIQMTQFLKTNSIQCSK